MRTDVRAYVRSGEQTFEKVPNGGAETFGVVQLVFHVKHERVFGWANKCSINSFDFIFQKMSIGGCQGVGIVA